MPRDLTRLEEATMNELLDELQDRCPAIVFAAVVPECGQHPSGSTTLRFTQGNHLANAASHGLAAALFNRISDIADGGFQMEDDDDDDSP